MPITIPPLTPVVSSNLAAVGYDPTARVLYVAFGSPTQPTLYAYDGVPPAVPALLFAIAARTGSVGSALNEHVKRAGYPYRRLPDDVSFVILEREAA